MKSTRRQFLGHSGILLSGMAAGITPPLTASRSGTAATPHFHVRQQPQADPGRDLQADLVILGAGTGGCAAAISALKMGLRVIMTEPTDWIGGQLTSQGVPPDENPWVETFGATASYRKYRSDVREFYRRNYPLTSEAREMQYLNPGNGWVSRICHEPRVSLAVLESTLAPWISNGRLSLLAEHVPVRAAAHGDRIRTVEVTDLRSGAARLLTAPWFIDATETGDLLKLAGAEYVTGAEGRSRTGEPHAPERAAPDNMQAFTLCFIVDHQEGENHLIDRPQDYSFWRDYKPELIPAWPGPMFSFTYSNPVTLEPRTLPFDPEAQEGWWAYRQIIDRNNFKNGFYSGNMSCINWPQNDYLLGNIIDRPEEEVEKHLKRAHQLGLSLFYWLQTEAPRPDGGAGWPGLRLRGDVLGTDHGMAKYPYIRESRRIEARFTVLEQHVGTEARMRETGLGRDEVRAARFEDSVGIGAYRIDLHPSTGGMNYIDISSLPFQIPLGALIPVRMRNLLPACKNIGTTHITNGCYRLQPVEWNIGESAGALAAFCKLEQTEPHEVYEKVRLTRQFQNRLKDLGVRLDWPQDKVHAL